MRAFTALRVILIAIVIATVPASLFGGVFISVAIAPPPLPVYTQPICPAAGYMWAPGYWAYGPAGYYWVPGMWVEPPAVDLLWTPGYWGWRGGAYFWHAGYWGPEVGFYGGVHYGFGYPGMGFVGGAWRGHQYFYNTAVVRVNTTVIHNTYVRNVTNVNIVERNRVSYNGGTGGIQAQPTRREMQAEQARRIDATPNQVAHRNNASAERGQLYSENRGSPVVASRERVNGQRYDSQGRATQGFRTRQTGMESQRRQDRPEHQVYRVQGGGRGDRR